MLGVSSLAVSIQIFMTLLWCNFVYFSEKKIISITTLWNDSSPSFTCSFEWGTRQLPHSIDRWLRHRFASKDLPAIAIQLSALSASIRCSCRTDRSINQGPNFDKDVRTLKAGIELQDYSTSLKFDGIFFTFNTFISFSGINLVIL